ncbi:MAG: DUF1343 domain-containing protein [Candidatus Sulfobium sp.]|jgi:uncharacterized protein YbbC (DUF1343 family)
MPDKIRTGLDLIGSGWPSHLKDSRVGLLVHPASVTGRLAHAVDICLKSRAFRLSALFGPQHGIRGESQDNMIEWDGFRDGKTGLPVYSLYGKTRRPSREMLRDVEVMVIDLQDVGARYYTFIWTMALVMEACMEMCLPVVVADRPNPVSGHLTEGPVLKPGYRSFVGLHELPVRHGMTIGEIACYLKDHFYPSLDLYVIRMKGWERRMWFEDTGLPWVLPSPNMPAVDTAIVYPGMCLLEGTNMSEGRGTTRPFEIFGAPFVEPYALVKYLSGFKLPGVRFRPLHFLPAFQKYSGRLCGGAQLHITDREKFRPFRTAVAVLKAVHGLYPEEFAWKEPPYEYEETLLPIDILAGTGRLRKEIEGGVGLKDMELWWKEELREFNREVRKAYLLY